MRPRRLVLATGNAGKVREMQSHLEAVGVEVLPQNAFDFPPAVEDAPTFVENALKKARHAARYSGLPAVADDSGLVVPALAGAPGVHSARYAGEGAGDEDNVAKLLDALAGEADRRAWFHCAMVYVAHPEDPTPVIAEGRWEGWVATAPYGEGGFGYDPVFLVAPDGPTAAQLAPDEKHRLSHRGQALRALLRRLGWGVSAAT